MTPQVKRFIASSTFRLAGTYLAIIMLMSISFSFVFYNTSSHALDRQVPPPNSVYRDSTTITIQPSQTNGNVRIQDFLNNRADEGRQDLALRLVFINILTLLLGAIVSYLLARRTLQPIEANMEAQRQFVSDASHELRTPLTAIQTSNDVALRNKKLTLTEAKAVISENTAEAIKLKQLSDGLLDLARGGNQSRPLVPTSLQAAVSDALGQVVGKAQAKDIAVEDKTAKLTVLSDAGILSQIIVILLDNAIKYSPEGSMVTISTETKGGQAYLRVRDHGVGIRASDVPHLFRRFYRADNARTSSHQDGYGLGLAIADTLAQTHGGSISVESELHKGSTFSVRLPLAK